LDCITTFSPESPILPLNAACCISRRHHDDLHQYEQHHIFLSFVSNSVPNSPASRSGKVSKEKAFTGHLLRGSRIRIPAVLNRVNDKISEVRKETELDVVVGWVSYPLCQFRITILFFFGLISSFILLLQWMALCGPLQQEL
jgi:hypothetical protein